VPERIWEPEAPGDQPIESHEEERHGGQAAPVVRRRARELGIDLATVTGSGPGGRILLEDLERYTAQPAPAAVSPPPAATPAPEGGAPLSRMRAAIARTVSEAWRTIPHFSVTMAIDMAEEVRRELKASGTPVSLNDMVIKAASLALAKFPLINASFTGEAIVTHYEINIGIAVSLPDGLLVPVIKGCGKLSLKEIAQESRRLVGSARSGRISETDITGGTFSISNLGMYGVKQFFAVIHPPQAAILAVGAVNDVVALQNAQPQAARMMEVTLSADHRIVDGAYAAGFLQELKQVLENPVQMLVQAC
jgi:pyruvate dehydrogenase E2 component (dihydrolipoamide acetyltransferase)